MYFIFYSIGSGFPCFTLIQQLSLGLFIVDFLEIVDFLCADGQIHFIKIPLNFQYIFLIVAFNYFRFLHTINPRLEVDFVLQGAKKKTDPPILRFSDYIFALIASTY